MTDWKKVLHAVMPRDKIRLVVREVADEMAITPGDIMGVSRYADIVWARQIAMWRISNELNMPAAQIGRIFQKDHTTVLHALKRVEEVIGETECLEA